VTWLDDGGDAQSRLEPDVVTSRHAFSDAISTRRDAYHGLLDPPSESINYVVLRTELHATTKLETCCKRLIWANGMFV